MSIASFVLAATVLLTLALVPDPASTGEPDIHGLWATPGIGSLIELHPCGNTSAELCGRIIWLRDSRTADSPRADSENPDKSKRARPLVGLQVISGFQQTGEGTWTGGRLYNPDDGQTYSGSLRSMPDGTLEVTGCTLGLFCQSQTWHRANGVVRELRQVIVGSEGN